jgi:hypothetical protein
MPYPQKNQQPLQAIAIKQTADSMRHKKYSSLKAGLSFLLSMEKEDYAKPA